jgi:parallel beta-helix repeat protein
MPVLQRVILSLKFIRNLRLCSRLITFITFLLLINTILLHSQFQEKTEMSFKQLFIVPENAETDDNCGKFLTYFAYDTIDNILFSIVNANNIFNINSSDGSITVKDNSALTSGIHELIIKTQDSYLYDIDTAVIVVKHADSCIFIDPAYSGSETGNRNNPYNSWSDITEWIPGFAYFQKRNTVYGNNGIRVPPPGGLKNKHIVLAAYGKGKKPEIYGYGTVETTPGIYIGFYDNPAAYVDVFSFIVHDWSGSGIGTSPATNHIFINDCEIYNCKDNAGIYIYRDINDSGIKLYNKIYNTISYNNKDEYGYHGIKLEGSKNELFNCHLYGNGRHGLQVPLFSSDNIIKYVYAHHNDDNGFNIASDTNKIYNCVAHNNQIGFQFLGNSHNNFISNCKLYNNRWHGIGIYDYGKNMVIKGNTIWQNTDHGIRVTGEAQNIEILNNDIFLNQGNGIFINYHDAAPLQVSNVKLLYNIVYNNGSEGISINDCSSIFIYNNTLFNNNTGIYVKPTATNISIINNIHNGIEGGNNVSNNLNHLDINPLFVQADDNDFRLLYGSPAIDAGIDVGLEYDFEGNHVPYNTSPDIGAYEFVLRDPSDTLPHAPTNLSGNATYYYQAVISWEDNSDNEYGFEIERSLSPESGFKKIYTVYQNVTSFTNNGLSPLTTYYYRIRAYNNTGFSRFSNTLSISTPAIPPPNAPSSLRTTNVGTRDISLRWNDNSDNEEKFLLERSNISGNEFSVIVTLGANQTSYTDNSLEPLKTYYYRIRAYSQHGYSTYSNELSVTTSALQPPATPTNLSASDITKNSLLLKWEDNASNEEGFRIHRSLISESEFTQVGSVGANILEYADSGLDPYTTYYYRIRAYNGDGESGNSNELEITTLQLQPPAAPTNLESAFISHNLTRLEWTDNSNNESGFQIFRTSVADSINYQLIHTTNQNISTYTDSLLLSDTTYLYRIRAFNDDGISGYTNILSVTTLQFPPPEKPSGLISKEVSKFTISISWLDNSDDEDGFEIEKSIGNNDNFNVIDTLDVNITDFQDIGLVPDVTYYYRIRAFNQIGYSDYSNVITITTLPLEIPNSPTLESVIILPENSVRIVWKDNSDNESGFQIERADESSEYMLIYAPVTDDTTWTDTLLNPGIKYYYRIRAFNNDGFSDYSDTLEVIIEIYEPPVAPSSLKAESVNDNTITLCWADNSENETGFIVKRALEPEKDFQIIKTVNANDTSLTDKNLKSNTIYYYQVNAVNNTGVSDNSNTAIASTMSVAETKRVWEGLVAYYNFNLNSGHIVHDFSNRGEPLDLAIVKPSGISWENNNKFEIITNTSIKSITPATKIVEACKKTNEITLECWLKSSFNHMDRTSNILSISKNNEDIGALLAQEHIFGDNQKSYNYLIRLKTNATAANGAPDLYADNELSFLTLHHLIYTKDKYGVEKIYLNGEEVANNIRPEGMDNWDNQYYLVLGNDMDQNYPWYGTYYNVAIYNIALNKEQILKNYNAGPSDNLAHTVIDYDIEIYPNPSEEGVINLRIIPQSENEFVDKTMIQISNIMGDLVYSEIIEDPNRELAKSLNLSEFSKGIYILRVITKDHFNSEIFILR